MLFRLRSGKALPMILAGCVLVSAGVGIGVGMFLGKGAMASPDKKKKHHEVEPAVVFSLGEMVVNLADTDTLRYVKVSVALGIVEKMSEEKLKEHTPAMRDAVIEVLTNKKFTELHRSTGIPEAKREISAAVEERVHDVKIARVYFEGFAMQ